MGTHLQMLTWSGRDTRSRPGDLGGSSDESSESEEGEGARADLYFQCRVQARSRDGSPVTIVVSGVKPCLFLTCAARMGGTMLLSARILLEDLGVHGYVSGMEAVVNYIFQGYREAKTAMVRIQFSSDRGRRIVTKALQRKAPSRAQVQLFNSRLSSLHQTLALHCIAPCSWVAVPAGRIVRQQVYLTLYELKSMLLPEAVGCAPFHVCSFDIEVDNDPDEPRAFPVPSKTACAVRIISCCTQRGEGSPHDVWTGVYLREGQVYDGCSDCTTTVYGSEQELLSAWARHVNEVDVLIGYNTNNFDMWFIYERCRVLGCLHVISEVHRRTWKQVPAKLQEDTKSSAGMGHICTRTFATPGIVQLDLLPRVKRDLKLESHTLSNVARAVLGTDKLEMPYTRLFEILRGPGEGLAEAVAYCVRDVELPLLLLRKLNILNSNLQLSDVCMLPLTDILDRGQQIRGMCMMTAYCWKNGFVIEDGKRYTVNSSEEGYEGAIVLDAKQGFYTEPVWVMDFASLYPSIMRSQNLCFSTLVMPELPSFHAAGRMVKTFSWRDEKSGVEKCTSFVQNREGIIPQILATLWEKRKQVKRAMKSVTDSAELDVLDAKQLAYKVTMNSIYGLFGVHESKAMLACHPIAQTVTFYGRKFIECTKRYLEEHYQANIVYGDTDSVFAIFPNATRENGFGIMDEASSRVTEYLNSEMCYYQGIVLLEPEKVFHPFLLLSKKRYAGLKYESLGGVGKIDAKGLSCVRRDWCEFSRETSWGLLQRVLQDQDTSSGQAFVMDSVTRLGKAEVPTNKLVLSKTLRDSYKGTPPVHSFVAKAANREGYNYGPGDRVPYVLVHGGGNKHGTQADKAVHPELMGGKKIDTHYYVLHQMQTPLLELMRVVNPSFEKEVWVPQVNALKLEQEGQPKITSMFFKKARVVAPEVEASGSILIS